MVGPVLAADDPTPKTATPEIWVEQLENRIPNITSAGHTNNSICYLLRIAGGGDEKTDRLDLYQALSFRVRDKYKNILQGDYGSNNKRRPDIGDIIGLSWPYTQQLCNIIYMEGDTLIIPDGANGAWSYKGLKQGKFYIDVTLDTTWHSMSPDVSEMEKAYAGPTTPFFTGAILCGTLTLHVGKARQRAHKKAHR